MVRNWPVLVCCDVRRVEHVSVELNDDVPAIFADMGISLFKCDALGRTVEKLIVYVSIR